MLDPTTFANMLVRCAMCACLAIVPAATEAASPAVPQEVIDALIRANAAVVGVEVTAVDGARSAETLGPAAHRLGRGDRLGRPDPDHRLPDAGGGDHPDRDPATTASFRREPWPMTWPPASACSRPLLPLSGTRPGAAGQPQRSANRRTADGRDGRRGRRRGHDAAGEQAAVLRVLGIPHRSRAVHQPADRQPQRRAAVQPARRIAGDRQPVRRPTLWAKARACRATCSCRSICSSPSWPRCSARAAASKAGGPGWDSPPPSKRAACRSCASARTARHKTAALMPGDVVLAVDGAKVATLEEFYKRLWAHRQSGRRNQADRAAGRRHQDA